MILYSGVVYIARYYHCPKKERNYGLRATKSSSHLTKFLVNNIHSYVFKLIYYENTFRKSDGIYLVLYTWILIYNWLNLMY